MSYTKQHFVKGQVLKADHLNHMEDGIAEAMDPAVGIPGAAGDGTTAEAGLPNITGNIKSIPPMRSGYTTGDGAFADSKGSRSTAYADSGSAACRDISFDASRSSTVYGNSDTVQPAAYYVYIWHRVA